ncbi:unnamed protein product [Ascophyllum nodosum]
MVASTEDVSCLETHHVDAAFGLQAEFSPGSAVGRARHVVSIYSRFSSQCLRILTYYPQNQPCAAGALALLIGDLLCLLKSIRGCLLHEAEEPVCTKPRVGLGFA